MVVTGSVMAVTGSMTVVTGSHEVLMAVKGSVTVVTSCDERFSPGSENKVDEEQEIGIGSAVVRTEKPLGRNYGTPYNALCNTSGVYRLAWSESPGPEQLDAATPSASGAATHPSPPAPPQRTKTPAE